MNLTAALITCLTTISICQLQSEPAKLKMPPMQFQHRVLANGLEFYSVEDHSNPTVAIDLWYHVGSKDDPEGRSGFAHLFEHMMFKGTKHMQPETIDRLTEDVGGSNNAFTAADVTVFFEVVPSNYLEPLLWAEAERMSSLAVNEENFKSERAVVKEEYRQRILAQPYGEFGEEIERKSFAVHPYKRPTIGNIAELDAATLKDVRAFHSTYYRPDNATLIVVGDFEPKQLDEWVDRYLGAIERPKSPIPRVTIQEPPRKESKKFVEYDAKVPLPALAITYLGPRAVSNDALTLDLAEEILAGGDSSRLYRALVYQQQLADSVSFDAELREDLGLLTFKVILASGKAVDDARKSLLDEIKKLQDAPVSPEELMKAKNRVITAKLHERETFEGKAMALGQAAVVQGDPMRVNTELDKLAAVSTGEVQDVMKKYFNDSNSLVIDYLPQSMKPSARKDAKP